MSDEFYWERVDRNIGVIGKEGQQKLRDCTVGIAGCGGMGGHIAEICVRIGVGHIKFTDPEMFDVSNINRQKGAMIGTVGLNKAIATAQMLERIVGDDVQLDCDMFGIDQHNAEQFIAGCDYIFDEIEFFRVRSRIILHRACRKHGIPVFNCNVIGFGTRIFKFTPESMPIEEMLDLDEDSELTEENLWKLIHGLAPRLPAVISEEVMQDWVFNKRKAPILGSTPSISSGVVVNRFIIELLGVDALPGIELLPAAPAYAYFDAGTFEAGIIGERQAIFDLLAKRAEVKQRLISG